MFTRGAAARSFGIVLCACALAELAPAAQITFGGSITQSTQDGTGPAANNPSLNNILDGDAYFVTLTFPGSISSPGAFNPLAGATLRFSDPAADALETGFSPVSLTISPDGSISLLGCLTTGTACNQGNELDANFQIPIGQLNLGDVTATAIAGLTPLDLLEDDGSTDIQGSVTSYSYNPAPEPGQMWALGAALIALAWCASKSTLKKKEH